MIDRDASCVATTFENGFPRRSSIATVSNSLHPTFNFNSYETPAPGPSGGFSTVPVHNAKNYKGCRRRLFGRRSASVREELHDVYSEGVKERTVSLKRRATLPLIRSLVTRNGSKREVANSPQRGLIPPKDSDGPFERSLQSATVVLKGQKKSGGNGLDRSRGGSVRDSSVVIRLRGSLLTGSFRKKRESIANYAVEKWRGWRCGEEKTVSAQTVSFKTTGENAEARRSDGAATKRSNSYKYYPNGCVILIYPTDGEDNQNVTSSLNFDLRQYLGTRFPKGQRDHELQNCIRDNVYLRTVPVTTRQPRPGEVNGVDYTFLSAEEFEALQRSGSLLEAGVFEGNHYGTPKPPSYGGEGSLRGPGGGHPLLPGAHPSSEGKRRRNRSNVEAMAATAIDVPAPSGNPPPELTDGERTQSRLAAADAPDDLGPLPPNWEKAFTENGEPYFIDHVAGTSSWLDPRLARVQKRTASECGDHELPFGWERIDDPQYGTYYIDHVNRKTQYENPVQVAKSAQEDNTQEEEDSMGTYPRIKKEYQPAPIHSKHPEKNYNSENKRSHSRSGPSAFTRNPSELQGEFLSRTLIKSSRGLGFTIVGGDDNEEEFLQIKSVVPNGPAWQDGHLRTADVLVYVNDTCVLGYTHADVVTMFQNIDPGHTVHLEVCRGYALPFDPNDPNTDIVTTVAVTSAGKGTHYSRSSKSLFADEYDRSRNNSSAESMNTAKSMPDLSNTERIQVPRPGSADLLSSENYEGHGPDLLDLYPSTGHPASSSGPVSPVGGKPEYLSIPIVKGGLGFGFTIADSAHGQKVKKILDRNRCKILAEGDVLVDINSICVKGKSHTEVVQVLKDCPMGQEAMVMVQRGGGSPSKRGTSRKEQPPSPKKVIGSGLFRSKTPTADMYSQQEKEIVPNRPKTPIVDTRSRPKTPNYGGDQDIAEGGRIEQRSHDPRAHYHPYQGSFTYVGSQPGDINPEPKLNNLSNQLGHMGINGNSFDNCSPEQFQQNFHHFEGAGGDNISGNYNYPRDVYSQQYQPNPHSCEYEKGYNEPVHSYSQQYNYYNNNNSIEQPVITSNGYNDHNNGAFLESNMQYGGYVYPKETMDVPRQDSGYSSQAQIPPSRNPYPPYIGQNSSVGYGGSGGGSQHGQNSNAYFNQQSDMQRRKESTSFEMEHPAPVPTLRESRSGPNNIGIRGQSNGLPMQPPHPHEFTVVLQRQETGFGFRIVGGTEEGSQVSIGHIVPGGAADLDHSIMSGDEIVGVDGERVLGSSHHRVVNLMSAASSHGRVVLILRRPATLQRNSHPNNELNRSMEIQYPYDITVTRREHEGFGFVIISSVAKAGSTIGRIIEGSPAERCGRLHIGDRILRVNAVDIKSLHHGSIVNLIKESGYTVTLTIGPPRDDASSTTSNSQQAESEVGDEPELLHVELSRGNRGFGFSIRGGKEFHSMPLFVLRIAENGPAAEDGKLKVGDQLVEINGVSTRDMTHADAIELIKQCGSSVMLIVRRGAKIQSQFDALSNAALGSPVGPPPPGTHIRSTATLPTGSPGHSQMPYSQSSSALQYGYPGQFPQHGFPRSSSQPMHSSPANPQQVYPAHVTNGPLGQSSPRLLGPNDNYYWNRMQDHRAN